MSDSHDPAQSQPQKSSQVVQQDVLQANPALERLFAAAHAQQLQLPPNPSNTRLQGLPVDRFHTDDKQRGRGQPRSPRKDKDRQDAALLRQWLQASHRSLRIKVETLGRCVQSVEYLD